MHINNTNQTMVLTGAAGGMGLATCQYLAEQGKHILAIDCDTLALQTLVIQYPTQIHPLTIDLGSLDLIEHVETALKNLPPVAGLINMAGISYGKPIDELTDEAWERSFAVNVTPAMRLIKLIAPMMREQGGGSIVNVGSPVGLIGARKPSYAASKGALHGLTMSCARNLGPDNIRVNLLLPGTTITGMTSDWDEQRRHEVAQGNFLKRLCHAHEIAHMIGFLLSKECSYLTGSVVDMTAGGLWGH